VLAKNLTKTFSNVPIYAIITSAIDKKVRKGLFLVCPDKGQAKIWSPQYSFQFYFNMEDF